MSHFRGIVLPTFRRIVFRRLVFWSNSDFCNESRIMSHFRGIVLSNFRRIVFRRLVFCSNLIFRDESRQMSHFRRIVLCTFHRIVFRRLVIRSNLVLGDELSWKCVDPSGGHQSSLVCHRRSTSTADGGHMATLSADLSLGACRWCNTRSRWTWSWSHFFKNKIQMKSIYSN